MVIRGLMTGENTAGCDYRTFVRVKLAKLAARSNAALPAEIEINGDAPVLAFVAQGHWVADCPDCGRNRSMVWRSDSLYMCPACWNAAAGGDWRPVAWPEDAAEIEALLMARSLPESRNWTPTETLYALRAENESLGIE